MKKIFFLFLISLLALSCTKDPVVPTVKKRATLIYIMGDNNLSKYLIENINTMEQAYSGGSKVYILADLQDTDNRFNSNATLYELTPNKTSLVDSKIIKNYGIINSCDLDFFDRVVADIYAFDTNVEIKNLLMSSHGKSWVPYGSSIYKSIGVDDSAGKTEIEIDALALQLSKLKLDYLIFDACFMSSIEVLYQLRDVTDYIVASPAEILADGMNYKEIIKQASTGQMNGMALLDSYAQQYAGSSYTLTFVETAYLQELAEITKSLVEKYNLYSGISSVGLQNYSTYNGSFFYDFGQYMFKNNFMSSTDKSMYGEYWAKAIKNYLHSDYMFNITPIDLTYGVSFYPPKRTMDKDTNEFYLRLDWAEDSGLNRILNN